MKLPSFFVLFVVAIALLAAASFVFSAGSAQDKIKVTVYKSPSCGCCVGYASFLESSGFIVETVLTSDMDPIKRKYGIPSDMDSCHTALVEGYFVEGHVPLEAVNKLLSERPVIDGIALPDMPAGSPGMPGTQNEDYVIYSLKEGKSSVFMTIKKG